MDIGKRMEEKQTHPQCYSSNLICFVYVDQGRSDLPGGALSKMLVTEACDRTPSRPPTLLEVGMTWVEKPEATTAWRDRGGTSQEGLGPLAGDRCCMFRWRCTNR